jgi:probable phosphoglycerate mutase
MSEIRQLRFQRPPGATEVLLVRHGESAAVRDDEPFPMLDGQGDPELHLEGRAQAERIADRLQHEDVSAIYVSSLRRTAETAAPLAARLGIEPVVDADLREVHLGEWEGGEFRRRMVAQDPIALRLREQQRWDVIPGAEPQDQFAARVHRVVARIAARHAGECVAVFSHGATIGQVLAHAAGSRPFAFSGSDHGAISQIVVDGDRWIIRRFNDTAHLTQAFTTRPQPLT